MDIPVSVIIPTCNAGNSFCKFAKMVKKQTAYIVQVLIIDSSSTDKTVEIAKENGFDVEVIDRKDFGHGKTRQYALEKADTEIVVFLTQDALLFDKNAIKNLVNFLLADKKIGAVYGRQLPYPETGILGRFARLNNYPDISRINTFEDKCELGIKAAFLSDSFSVYKKSMLIELGGFPKHVNFGEDTYVAAKFLMNGYKTGYCAEAKVYHAHDYSLKQEYERCKEIGKFHKQEHWLLDTFGKAEGEGMKFVINEARYLFKKGKWYYLPIAFAHNFVKFLGYKIGKSI